MASPRTRKVLKEVRVQDENNVSVRFPSAPLSGLASPPSAPLAVAARPPPACPLLPLGGTRGAAWLSGTWPPHRCVLSVVHSTPSG